MKINPIHVVLSLVLAAAALAAAPWVVARAKAQAGSTASAVEVERPRPSNKWRIVFDERAKSDGTINFLVWPREGSPLQVDVAVVKGQSENHIAAAARGAFGVALGKDYHVEVDDGEDVLVKARHGTGDFGLQLLGSTVRDIDVKLHRE